MYMSLQIEYHTENALPLKYYQIDFSLCSVRILPLGVVVLVLISALVSVLASILVLVLMLQAAGVKSWQNSQSCLDLIPEGCKAAITSSIIDIMIKCKKQLEKHKLLLRCWQLLVRSGSQKFGISPLVVYDTKNDPKIFSHSTFPLPDFLDPWVKKKST